MKTALRRPPRRALRLALLLPAPAALLLSGCVILGASAVAYSDTTNSGTSATPAPSSTSTALADATAGPTVSPSPPATATSAPVTQGGSGSGGSGSGWSTGSLTLSDNATGTAMFDVANLGAGHSVSRCITLTSTGSPSLVRLYTRTVSADAALTDAMTVTIERGSGATGASCSGFALAGRDWTGSMTSLLQATDWSTGIAPWQTTGGTSVRSYRFTVSVGDDAPNSAMSKRVAADFTWEGQVL